jgi:signal transduction histidine kinase
MGNDTASFLRKVPLFAELPDPDLERISRKAQERKLAGGELLFAEGSIGEAAYVIVSGQIEIYKLVNSQKVQLAVRQPGEVIGETSLLESSPRVASGVAIADTTVISISRDLIEDLFRASPSAARTMLHTVVMRLQSTEASLIQSEKMAQLGSFTAGIAHEINNPSAAVLRGSDQLRNAFEAYQALSIHLQSFQMSPVQLEQWLAISRQIKSQISQGQGLNAVTRLDREEALENWLAQKKIANSWELAPLLVNLGLDPSALEKYLTGFPPESFATMLRWTTTQTNLQFLLEEIHQGAQRISDIVHALKSYIYLDQAPQQDVDIHEGLENTLIILRHKIQKGITIEREYDRMLPHITVLGSELNQVWTNLIDNAVDALQGSGRIILRTKQAGDWLLVEIEDNGPGIPEAVQPRLFYPFFTTKPVGKGTGLGLSISLQIIKKHGGNIQVFSQPGKTCFSVRLPLVASDYPIPAR